MKAHWLFLVAFVAAPAPALQDPPPVEKPAADPFFDLVKQYDSATKEWRDERRAAAKESKEKEDEVKARHPVREYWPRFEALLRGGDGRGLVWMAQNADDKFESSDEIRARKTEFVARLFKEYADAAWAATDLVALIPRQRSWFDEEWVRTKLDELATKSKTPDVSAAAYYELARRLNGSRSSAEDKARAAELFEKIERDYAGTAAAKTLAVKQDAGGYEVGGTPDDFEATDADGVKFKLSDYRGKVVMLDFWGFW